MTNYEVLSSKEAQKPHVLLEARVGDDYVGPLAQATAYYMRGQRPGDTSRERLDFHVAQYAVDVQDVELLAGCMEQLLAEDLWRIREYGAARGDTVMQTRFDTRAGETFQEAAVNDSAAYQAIIEIRARMAAGTFEPYEPGFIGDFKAAVYGTPLRKLSAFRSDRDLSNERNLIVALRLAALAETEEGRQMSLDAQTAAESFCAEIRTIEPLGRPLDLVDEAVRRAQFEPSLRQALEVLFAAPPSMSTTRALLAVAEKEHDFLRSAVGLHEPLLSDPFLANVWHDHRQIFGGHDEEYAPQWLLALWDEFKAVGFEHKKMRSTYRYYKPPRFPGRD